MKKIVLASHNPGKIREFSALMQTLSIEIIPQAELGVTEIQETGITFVENALLKARNAARQTGLPAISDDSGLSVKALGGAPGIYSARYAGLHAKAKDNNAKLLDALKNIDDTERDAHFHCVLVFMLSAEDPAPLICDGSWHGKILREPRGENGFGYDPLFYDLNEEASAAELSPAIKNKISHRGRALQALLHLLPGKL